MTTFDQILNMTRDVFENNRTRVEKLPWLLVNRDLNGRVRLIAPSDEGRRDPSHTDLCIIYEELRSRLGAHAHLIDSGILYEDSCEDAYQGLKPFALQGFESVGVLDRLATETLWESIAVEASGPQRFVFFSIKGGVGRSTALAASAWSLAQAGKRVLVLDLDLESPGLSSALLPTDRQPRYGITDWLVEDLVNNTGELMEDMFAVSDVTTPGKIVLIPAHGRELGEYVSKLGRVWMPKILNPTMREQWSKRLNRMISVLEERHCPDVILIDSRAGIDEVAAACVTELGASTVFMFAIQGQQTWTGYQALFAHWEQRGAVTSIRERLQLVAGLVPDDERREDYLTAMRADAYKLFQSTYDEAAPGQLGDWSFDPDDDSAPHSPLAIRWNRGWYGMLSLQDRIARVNDSEVTAVFGPLQDFFARALIPKGDC